MEIARLLQNEQDGSNSQLHNSLLLHSLSSSLEQVMKPKGTDLIYGKNLAGLSPRTYEEMCHAVKSLPDSFDNTDDELEAALNELEKNQVLKTNTTNEKRKSLPSGDDENRKICKALNGTPKGSGSCTGGVYPKRRGKWLPEEEEFTIAMIDCFLDGVLPLIGGTTLRSYLATQLNCDPMRVTKKLSTHECAGRKVDKRIGKRTFNPRKGAELEMDKKMNMLSIMSERFWKAVGETPPASVSLGMSYCQKSNDSEDKSLSMNGSKPLKRRKRSPAQYPQTQRPSGCSSVKDIEAIPCLPEDIESANLLLDLQHRHFVSDNQPSMRVAESA